MVPGQINRRDIKKLKIQVSTAYSYKYIVSGWHYELMNYELNVNE
jgi:hypothetical protein